MSNISIIIIIIRIHSKVHDSNFPIFSVESYRRYTIYKDSVQSLSPVQLFATPWIAVRQASLSITNSRSSFKLMSIESVMPSSYLILCRPLLLLPPIPPSIRVFSNDPRQAGHGGEVWQKVVHWRREWQTTSVFLLWKCHEQYVKAKW